MRFQLLYPAVLLSLLVSCSATQVSTSGLRQSDINDMAYFKPMAAIGLIVKGNHDQFNDSLTTIASNLQANVVHSLSRLIHVTTDILMTDNNTGNRIETEMYSLIKECTDREIVKDIPITPLIDSLLEKSGKRYGLITLNVGFTRVDGNFENQGVKLTAIGLLSLGMFAEEPIRANSTIFTIIADSKENHLVFYCKTSSDGKEPLDSNVLTKQMQKTFNRSF